MNKTIWATIAGLTLMACAGEAGARGCLTGAAVGGVAGHVAGHHGVIGAAAGCAINHHRNKVADRNAAAQRTQRTPSVAAAPAAPTAPVAPPR